MSYWSGGRSKIEDILDSQKPTIEELIKCDDIQALYRMNNTRLVNFLKQPSSIQSMYNLLRKTKDFQTVRRILGLHISPNTTIIHTVVGNLNLVESLLQTLDYENDVHRYVLGVVASILLKLFENWPRDTFNALNNSHRNFSRLIKASHIPGIFHLLNRFVTDNESQSTGKVFVWMLYLVIMDEHGPGCKIPSSVTSCKCYNTKQVKINQVHRCKVLELLCSYFNEFIDDTTDIFNAVNTGLPLMLQDSSDDYERSLVFKLGLTLNPNQALGLSAVSIVNCFKSSDLLMQYSLLYITMFEVNIGYRSIELFLYRLLNNNDYYNNFVIIAAAKMITSIVNESMDKTFVNNLRQIIAHCFKKEDTFAMRSFRTMLYTATDGIEVDPETNQAVDMIEDTNIAKNKIQVDKNFISSLQNKMNVIDQNKSFVPQFSVKDLWPQDDIARMQKTFKTIERITGPRNALKQTVNNPKQSQSKPAPQQQSVKKPSSKPNPINTKNDIDSDDDIALEEIELTPTKNDARRHVKIVENNKDNVNIDDEEEDDFLLEEIDVTDPPPSPRINFPPSPGRPFVAESAGSGPLTDQESIKEPRPLVEVPKDMKPTPKVLHLAPSSPRVQYRRCFDSSFYNDRVDPLTPKKIEQRIVQRMAPISLSSSSSSEEESEYEYEYVDEEDSKELKDAKAMIERHLALTKMTKQELEKQGTKESKDLKQSQDKHSNFTIDNVVSDLYIDNPKKKPTLNRRVLVVEVPLKVTKLKICTLDSFDDLSNGVMAPSNSAGSLSAESKHEEEANSSEEPVRTRRKHRHNSVPKPSNDLQEEAKDSKTEDDDQKRKRVKRKKQ